MRKFKITVTGITDLIMHNGRLAIQTDPAARSVAEAFQQYKQAGKTDAGFEAMARAEFLGGLYLMDEIGPFWPSDNFHTALKNAGKKRKQSGGKATLRNPIAGGILWGSEVNPLVYAGFGGRSAPRSAEELWKDENYRFTKAVRVGASKVVRTRPIFRDWKFDVEGTLDTDVLNFADLEAVVKIAGQLIGLGDWRPEKGGGYGRFSAEVTDLGEYDPLAGV
jgi:hypothetical protein